MVHSLFKVLLSDGEVNNESRSCERRKIRKQFTQHRTTLCSLLFVNLADKSAVNLLICSNTLISTLLLVVFLLLFVLFGFK